jgi:hypothetical protein
VDVLKRATDACGLFQGGEVVCYGDGSGKSSCFEEYDFVLFGLIN